MDDFVLEAYKLMNELHASRYGFQERKLSFGSRISFNNGFSAIAPNEELNTTGILQLSYGTPVANGHSGLFLFSGPSGEIDPCTGASCYREVIYQKPTLAYGSDVRVHGIGLDGHQWSFTFPFAGLLIRAETLENMRFLEELDDISGVTHKDLPHSRWVPRLVSKCHERSGSYPEWHYGRGL